MNQIYILYLVFSILFLIERKAINILMNYIGITLLIAIIIANNNVKDIEYISYILILVQISALTILFGFIIMLYPIQPLKTLNAKQSRFGIKYFGIFLLIIIGVGVIIGLLLLNLRYNPLNIAVGNDNFIKIVDSGILNQPLVSLDPQGIGFKSGENIKILKIIGELLYTNNNTIIKLIVLTIILLIAIVALFYIIP